MPSLRTTFVLTLAAAATALPAATALAASADGGAASGISGALPAQSVADALGSGIGPVKNLTLDPLSHTGADPLDNAVGTQIADFEPVSTAAATGPVTSGGSLSTLPLVGKAAGLLPG